MRRRFEPDGIVRMPTTHHVGDAVGEVYVRSVHLPCGEQVDADVALYLLDPTPRLARPARVVTCGAALPVFELGPYDHQCLTA